jgi:hypothetical protein
LVVKVFKKQKAKPFVDFLLKKRGCLKNEMASFFFRDLVLVLLQWFGKIKRLMVHFIER